MNWVCMGAFPQPSTPQGEGGGPENFEVFSIDVAIGKQRWSN